MKTIRRLIAASASALLTLLLPGSLMAKPIVVSINDVPNAAPIIQVKDAPSGYEIYTGPEVVDPTIEDGAAIILYDVDLAGLLPDWGGRFTVPNAPLWYRSAVDIVYVTHDPGIAQAGALVVAFDSALPGTYYFNPGLINPDTGLPLNEDVDLGPVTDNWVTVYENDTLVIRYKPHTYRLQAQVERPFSITGTVTWTVNLLDGSATGYHTGVATHTGLFTSDASVIWDLDNFVIVSGTGVATAANGDQLFWKMTLDQLMVVQWTGGTGRFAGVTGAWATPSVTVVAQDVDMSTMTMTMTLNYLGVGTITY